MQPLRHINTPASVVTPFANSHFVSRTEYFSIAHGVTRVLLSIDAPKPIASGSRQYHQEEAVKAAYMVAHQFTAQAKTKAKRACLGHLIALLSYSNADIKAGKA